MEVQADVVMNMDLMADGTFRVNAVSSKYDTYGIHIELKIKKRPFNFKKAMKRMIENYPSCWVERLIDKFVNK